ncbi:MULTISPECIES: efflux RND transporter permease subunit [Bradyrhizobium]|uniref:efflux RND transporter permease subunit n=1 Tax=Bradyrhizobium TaxID=374 RepID=UPI00155EE1FE|nr:MULTISPECIES: efflux RND transporter permease subunit [Bradyrhizobium]MDD1520750.1 RND transporter [Bradyrhizobium sp. WBAH30]MDD1545801.1 RND transporter [Bradyrhizobium sp. WBAH41]MDD1558938.1 RND transporter [Bradyrhizobium sp. WBAH23]MDD1566412.1 RND transporter [Bradyrhizobium sp. WBAH33]MDD1592005.1 RND transporter [Bradyrhizobium sp. WBAH42]
MNLATWSIRNPIPSIMLFAVLAIAGLWGFRALSIQSFPDLDLPVVNVTLTQPGAAPSQLETEVARKVEDSLATLSGLRHLRTSVTDGRVSIGVEFVLEKGLSEALIETKDAVDRVRSELPVDVQPPTVSAQRAGGNALLIYAISSTRLDEEALSWFVDDTIAKAVLGVPGVGRFERVGGVQREVRVEVDPVRLAALGITAADVSRTLRQVQQQSSGGRAQLEQNEQAVRTTAIVRQASDLAALPIALSGLPKARLDQVATVQDTIADRTQLALLDGKSVVGFRIYRAKGFDETKIAATVRREMERLEKADPTLKIKQVSGSIDYTLEQYAGSMHMLYEGALLAVLVVWWFLRDWRATLIAAAALPLSVLPAFAAMAWLEYSLNTVTLLALAVIVGILVDDAIVEIENIERHRAMGKPILQAASEAVTEIGLAVVATTMTLVVVFLPTALMSGISGMLFKQFGWTAVIAVLASLVVARLLTPMMAAYLLKSKPSAEHEDGVLTTTYLSAVRWCLRHRKTTALGALLFFFASVALIPLIPTGLIPASDRGYTTVSIELPPGSSLQSTLRVAEDTRAALKDVPGIENVFTTVGDSQTIGPGAQQAGEVRRGALVLMLAPRGQRERQVTIENRVRTRLPTIPGARFAIGSGGLGEKIQFILSSDNVQALRASAQTLEQELRGAGRFTNIKSTASLERPEIVVRPDPQQAAERGVTTASIGDVVRIATSGDFDAQVARLNLDSRQVYIRVRVSDAARQNMDTLANMRVSGRNGPVPLSSVAAIAVESGPSQIDRYDRRRYVTVDADLGGMALGTAQATAMALPAIQNMPSAVKLIRTGDSELAGELAAGFGMALVAGVLSMFCVLVLLFKDFLQPVTILSALPLSVGGAFVALLVARSELDLPVMIGFVMLMGIVAKNSILLVEYAVVGMRERGLSMHDALVDACSKRARPVVMTTIAMIAGMLPIAMGFGADATFRQPMAISVIGGLLTSTALSLLIVPVAFTYVDGFERSIMRLRERFMSRQQLKVRTENLR